MPAYLWNEVLVAHLRPEEFEEAVAEAVDNVPPEFARAIQNVDVVVRERPSPADLEQVGVPSGGTILGLYHGVPLTERGAGYQLILPDKISIYREPIEMICERTGIPVPEMVRRVVLHEVAHYFGISDAKLRKLGY
ncbi:MAG: metallopeptidase family protein [Actinomycetia bacterium]|nr:metallopeptidase family protein [Actinomycetes bacterium]